MDKDITVESHGLRNLMASLQNAEWSGAGASVLPESTILLPDGSPLTAATHLFLSRFLI